MKTKLLFKTFLITSALCATNSWSQTNLVQNGTADEFNYSFTVIELNEDNNMYESIDTNNTGDNADAWDMTPNSKVILNNAVVITDPDDAQATVATESTSPYRFNSNDNPTGWRNEDLESFISTNYGNNEQPATSSDGDPSAPSY